MRQCGPGEASSNRLWRKSLRDNNTNGIYGDSADGVDPNRNFPEQWALDEEGSSANPSNGDYRGPYANSEPENFYYDRLLQRIKPVANLNYHSAAQLLNSSFGFITNRPADDNTLARSLSGTDGDAAVDPYQPDQASDLYVTHGETVDWAYFQFGTIGFTPELDTAQTAGSSANSFVFPDDEDKVNAVFEKNLPLALNLAWSAASDDFDRPSNFFDDASRYQVKATLDIEPTAFDVSYGGDAARRGGRAPRARPDRLPGLGLRPRRPQPDAVPARRGLQGRRALRRRARQVLRPRPRDRPGGLPAHQHHRHRRPAAPGRRRRQRHGDRPRRRAGAALLLPRAGHPAGREQAARARRRGRGLHRHGAEQDRLRLRPALPAAARRRAEGRGLRGRDVTTSTRLPGTIKYPTFLGVLSHFDAVLYYTGDDLRARRTPASTDYRRLSSATTLTGDTLISQWGAKGWFNLRDYLNEGGKLVVSGRNAHQTFASSSTGLTAYSGYQFNPDPFYGFHYPPNNLGDDHRPGTAFIREHEVNNDIEQYFFGVGQRQGGAGTTTYNAAPIAPTADSIFAGVAPFTVDTAAGNDPTQDLDGNADAAHEVGHAPAHADRDPLEPGAAAAAAPGEGRAGLRHDAGADDARAARRSPRATRSRSASASSRSTRPRATRSWPRRSATCCRPRRHDRAGGRASPTRPS